MKSSIFLAVEADVQPEGLGGDFEKNARFISDLGFNGADLSIMNLDQVDRGKVKEVMKRYRLEVPAIASGRYFLKHGLSLSTSNRDIREKAIDKVEQFVGFAGELGSNYVIGPVQGEYEKSYEEGFNYLKDSLQQCAKFAEKQGVLLLIEPMNRFIPAIIRTIGEGVKIVDKVGSPSVRLVADTFHMNIEEKSMTESIKHAKGYIAQMHFCDNDRRVPGQGHIDFRKIAETLKEIGYKGFVSAEILPEPDPATAARLSIEFIKSLPY
jgi:sugar phosphate isomerase/epimerase